MIGLSGLATIPFTSLEMSDHPLDGRAVKEFRAVLEESSEFRSRSANESIKSNLEVPPSTPTDSDLRPSRFKPEAAMFWKSNIT